MTAEALPVTLSVDPLPLTASVVRVMTSPLTTVTLTGAAVASREKAMAPDLRSTDPSNPAVSPPDPPKDSEPLEVDGGVGRAGGCGARGACRLDPEGEGHAVDGDGHPGPGVQVASGVPPLPPWGAVPPWKA